MLVKNSRKKAAFSAESAKLIQLQQRVIGQTDALSQIMDHVAVYEAGLNPENRPAGVFLMLGPTGTGKTHTVQALAEVLHGSKKNILRIDCGEYQMEHEVAKLIGAPPGYLGHRETQPVLTQLRLNQSMSDRCNVSIVLFDEIEKAAPSLQRLLLGVLDNAVLRLGDNNIVNFERTLIFMTSNVGSADMSRELSGIGMERYTKEQSSHTMSFDRMKLLTRNAAKRKFAPEFMNRVDAVLTYQSLTDEDLSEVLSMELQNVANHISKRMGDRRVYLQIPKTTKEYLLKVGTSKEYGARELKRALNREIVVPLAKLLSTGQVDPGSTVRFTYVSKDNALKLSVVDDTSAVAA